MQLIENLQPFEVHELNEALGYETLLQLHPKTYTIETVAEKTHLIEEV